MNTSLPAIIAALPQGSWIRAEAVRYRPTGVELAFVALRSRRGNRIASWQIVCGGVRELSVSDLDGGGIQLYSSSHPAAKQYSADGAALQWRPSGRGPEALGALLAAHIRLVDDWIPFERYTSPRRLEASQVTWRGPEFVMRAYARALRELGLPAKVVPKRRLRRTSRPRCLHFGNSFVVSNRFRVVSGATGLPNKELKLTKRG
jgi:hypothetical protein